MDDPKNSNSQAPGNSDQDNSTGKQKDNSNADNIKNLQQKLTEKDKLIKDMQAKMEEKKDDGGNEDIKNMQETISQLNETIAGMQKERKVAELAEKYPDISPELLADLPDDKIDDVVKNQREIAKRHYKGAEIFKKPQFSSKQDVDKKIDAIKNDENIGSMKKAGEILRLKRIRDQFD